MLVYLGMAADIAEIPESFREFKVILRQTDINVLYYCKDLKGLLSVPTLLNHFFALIELAKGNPRAEFDHCNSICVVLESAAILSCSWWKPSRTKIKVSIRLP